MPAPLGGIGQQVADNLFELGKSTVQSIAQVGGDLVKDSIEQISGAPKTINSQSTQYGGQASDPGRADGREKEIARQADRRRYEQVKAELEQFRQRKAQLDKEIAVEKKQQEQDSQQKIEIDKRKRESFVQKMLRKVGAGAHGETAKQKE